MKSLNNLNNLTPTKDTNIIQENIQSTIWDAIYKELNNYTELTEYLENYSNKLADSNFIINIYTDFTNYLNTLSQIELCLFINILGIIFIALCLISIITSFYGNILISKLNLEIRFPKLAKIIKLRMKLNHYYIISNLIFIFICLFIMMHVTLISFFTLN